MYTYHNRNPEPKSSYSLTMAPKDNAVPSLVNTTDGQDLKTLLDLLNSFNVHNNNLGCSQSRTVSINKASTSQISPSRDRLSSQALEVQRQDNSESSLSSGVDPLDFGLVDSLTLVDCKRLELVLDTEEEMISEDENETIEMEFPLVRRSSLLQARNRTGVRRGDSMEFTVLTKS